MEGLGMGNPSIDPMFRSLVTLGSWFTNEGRRSSLSHEGAHCRSFIWLGERFRLE